MARASRKAGDQVVDPDRNSRPVVPDYGGACLSSLLHALDARASPEAPGWLPEAAKGARQVVLLVLDGVGWEKLRAARSLAPTLCEAEGGPITSVAPTTTATALTSITTGRAPAEHGVVGYRLRVPDGDAGSHGSSARSPQGAASDWEVLNVLRWRTGRGDARRLIPAPAFQPIPPFGGAKAVAVTRAEFAATGFTALHLAGAKLVGWALPSTLVVQVRRLLAQGEPLVYAYYDGLDKVAHAHGLGDFYSEELRAVDRWVGDLAESLPPGCALVVTSDHGQVEVGPSVRLPGPELLEHTEMLSGEGRFRWLHARPGATSDLLSAASEAHGSEAWVLTREQIVEEGWFGGPLAPHVAARLGDVALVAREPVAFLDPADTGETRLAARHGSLTPAEMYVPLIAWRAA
ncbi:MAG TPA: alkaline phosphatase family protein [Acidimicrobiales bacterium]|nr:alkaline phosphatase family protein [Acidimicrobiales bacterium]